MYIYLTKMLAQLLMPVGLLWLLLASLSGILLYRRRFGAFSVTFFLFIFLSFAGNEYFSKYLLRTLEEPYATLNPLDTDSPFDAIYILGGGGRYRADSYSYLGLAGDRLMLATRLYHQGKVKNIVAVASHTINSTTDSNLILESAGVPSSKIIPILYPINTTMEMERFLILQKKHHWKRIGLITSAWHMPRALRLAKKVGLDFIPLPADYRGYSTSGRFSMIPTARSLYFTETAAWEYLGQLAGR